MSLVEILKKNSTRVEEQIKERKKYIDNINSIIIENTIREQFKQSEESLKIVSNFDNGISACWEYYIEFTISTDKFHQGGDTNMYPLIKQIVYKFFANEGFEIVDYQISSTCVVKVNFSWR